MFGRQFFFVVARQGIFKADIGIKDGMISGIGKAGNPDVMDHVTAGMVVGVCTEVISAEGRIVTAGALDTHVHFICPQQAYDAIASGVTVSLGFLALALVLTFVNECASVCVCVCVRVCVCVVLRVG